MQTWTELMRAPSRELRMGGVIVLTNAQELPLEDRVVRFELQEGTDGALLPGDVMSARCTLELVADASLQEMLFEGATLLPVLYAGSVEKLACPLGAFVVETAQHVEKENSWRLSGCDSIGSELSAAFEDEMHYPCSLQEIWEHALSYTRYAFSGNIPNGSAWIAHAPQWNGASLRTVLGYIAAAAGCFVRIGRTGALEICRVKPNASHVFALGSEDYIWMEGSTAPFGPVDALRIVTHRDREEVLYRAGSSALCVISLCENPLFVSGAPGMGALAQGTLLQLAGMGGSELRFDWCGDPELQIGDRVQLTSRNGQVYAGVLTGQKLIFEHGLYASCSCAVPKADTSGLRRALTPEGRLNAAALTGAIDGRLLSVGSIYTSKLAAGSVTAEKLAVGAVDAGALSAFSASIRTALNAGQVSANELSAAIAEFVLLTAGTAAFEKATVAHMLAEAVQLRYGVGEDVFIDNLRVNAAQLASAMIGNLCIKASDGAYYRLDVARSGAVSAVPVTLSAGEIDAGETSEGRVIVETELLASTLSCSNLLSTYALINRLDAARIDVDQLFAREAFVSRLNTSEIIAGKSLKVLAGEIEAADALRADFYRVLRMDEAGLHVGDNLSSGEVLIDSESVNVAMNGRKYAKFAANYVQFGNYQLRQSADGGLVFKLK